eukprot:scaffold1500_cov398-Prasinococcus_capsulatus_cf.AAC.5
MAICMRSLLPRTCRDSLAPVGTVPVGPCMATAAANGTRNLPDVSARLLALALPCTGCPPVQSRGSTLSEGARGHQGVAPTTGLPGRGFGHRRTWTHPPHVHVPVQAGCRISLYCLSGGRHPWTAQQQPSSAGQGRGRRALACARLPGGWNERWLRHAQTRSFVVRQ